MRIFWHFLYTLVLSLWIGGMATFTFLVTPAIFRSFGRDMAAGVVDILFPGYFLANLVLSVSALILLVLLKPGSLYRLSLLLISVAILVSSFVVFKLHPDIKKVKQEITSFESEPATSPMRAKFRKLHGVSAVLNLLLLADGVALLFISISANR